jgi:hypothetical protein
MQQQRRGRKEAQGREGRTQHHPASTRHVGLQPQGSSDQGRPFLSVADPWRVHKGGYFFGGGCFPSSSEKGRRVHPTERATIFTNTPVAYKPCSKITQKPSKNGKEDLIHQEHSECSWGWALYKLI